MTELTKTPYDLLFSLNPKLVKVPKMRKFLTKGYHFSLEKADLDNAIFWFEISAIKGWLPAMIAHRDATYPCFKWDNFDRWLEVWKTEVIAKPYPPQTEVLDATEPEGAFATFEGRPLKKYPDCAETIEEEEEITKRFVEDTGIPNRNSIKVFLWDSKKKGNEFVDLLASKIGSSEEEFLNHAIEGFEELLGVINDKEKSREIGNKLNDKGGIELMRGSYYLLCWYLRGSKSMLVGSYSRVVEHYWNEIGEWLA